MVLNQASLKRDGVQDYVSLRASAIVLASYTLFILGFFLFFFDGTFNAWHGLFDNLLVKVFTLLALISIAIHTRIGLWQVLTDYIKCAKMRAVLQFVLSVITFSYVAVGLFVLWGA